MSNSSTGNLRAAVRRRFRAMIGLHDDTAAVGEQATFGKAAEAWGTSGYVMLQAARCASAYHALHLVDSRLAGLTETEAAERRLQYGPNMITSMRTPPWYKILFLATLHPFNVLLVLLGIVAAATGDIATMVLLFVMVILSVTTRFVQEIRSNAAVESLRRKTVIKVKVLRARESPTLPELSSSATSAMLLSSADAYELSKNVDHAEADPAAVPHEDDYDITEVLIEDLVPGDVVLLSGGDLVPGDCRILSQKNLLINQAALTGESMAVEKSVSPVSAAKCEKDNTLEWETCALIGTSVESGTCSAVVVLTGDQTFFGLNARLLAGTTPSTAFDRGVRRVSFVLMTFMIIMVPIVIILNGATTHDWMNAFFFGIAVAVGLTPEMLPMIVNTNLARAAVTMSSCRVIVKRLQAVQNVGAMDVLCTDKTGTLTEDRIVVEHHVGVLNGLRDNANVLVGAGLAAASVIGNRNAIDRAILAALEEDYDEAAEDEQVVQVVVHGTTPENEQVAHQAQESRRSLALAEGHAELAAWLQFRNNMQIVGVVAFDFLRRRSSVIVRDATADTTKEFAGVLVCKGAVEETLSVCTTVELANDVAEPKARRSLDLKRDSDIKLPSTLSEAFGSPDVAPTGYRRSALTNEMREEILREIDHLLHQGFRVLMVAYKWKTCAALPKDDEAPQFRPDEECDLVLGGMLVLRDRPKTSTATAIANLQEGGIQIKVLTGDNEIVATQVCREVGLDVAEDAIITGSAFAKLEGEAKVSTVHHAVVFARLTPAQKAEVVQILQSKNHTVGFLGDGINDALALRQADVGISVDSATEVARDAADLILLEKDLNVIQTAVLEGRRTHGNTIKYIKMAASSNFGNVFSVLVAAAWLPFLPMRPEQLLVQNLLYDFSQLAIPWDNMDASYLSKPRPWDAGSMISFMVFIGPVSSLFDIGTFLLCWYGFDTRTAEQQAILQSCWFTLGLMTQTFIVHAIRTERIPFFQSMAAPIVCLTTLVICILAVAIPYTPIGTILNMVDPPPYFYIYLVSANLLYFVFTHIQKILYRKKFDKWL